MSGEVVALPGNSVPTPKGEPVKSVVELMREFTALAESGRLRAVLIAGIRDDGSESTCGDFAAAAGTSWALNASVGQQTRRFYTWFDE